MLHKFIWNLLSNMWLRKTCLDRSARFLAIKDPRQRIHATPIWPSVRKTFQQKFLLSYWHFFAIFFSSQFSIYCSSSRATLMISNQDNFLKKFVTNFLLWNSCRIRRIFFQKLESFYWDPLKMLLMTNGITYSCKWPTILAQTFWIGCYFKKMSQQASQKILIFEKLKRWINTFLGNSKILKFIP